MDLILSLLLFYYSQLYDDNTGIKLTPDTTGLCIVRAIAVTAGRIPSELFLSKSVSSSILLLSIFCRPL